MFAESSRLMKGIVAVTGVALLSCMGLPLYYHHLFVYYPEHAVTAFMDSPDHRTIAKRHSEYDWYIEVAIPQDLGELLLRERSFHDGYDPRIALPKIPSPDIKACTACWSYFEGKGRGLYGYELAVLSSDKRRLQLYEEFGN